MSDFSNELIAILAEKSNIECQLKKLEDFRRDFFLEGFEASQERRKYLALKIIELNREIARKTFLLKNVKFQIHLLNQIIDAVSCKQKISSDPNPITKDEIDSIYAEWDTDQNRHD